jgi:hypothetical protein
MIESTDEAPCLGPGKCFEIEVANVVQDVVVLTRDTADNEELVLMEDRCVSGSAFGNGAGDLGLCPVRCLEVEDDEIGKICSMLVLAAEDEEFISLVQSRCMT